MADNTLKGADEILYINDGTTYLPIGCLTSNSISKSIETKEGTITKCDQNPIPSYSTSSYEVTFEAVAVDNNTTKASYEKISTVMDTNYSSKTMTYWKIVAGSKSVFGKGFLTSLEKTAPADGEVTFSGTIQGVGTTSATDLKGAV